MSHILIVEDEPKLAALLRDYCLQAGYRCDLLERGDAVLPWLQSQQTDLIVLDLMLPGEDGLSVCRQVRQQSTVPILMATAKIDELDRLLGLELGADDYICKPYSPREVIARIKAILRRANMPADGVVAAASPAEAVTFELDEARLQVRYQAQSCELTAVEFQLLKQLCQHPGQIYSRQQLMEHMYGDNRIVSDRTIDSHIKKLRKKLADIAPEHELIQSVYGAGYRYQPPL